jgi:uncharacterized protein YcbX
MIIGTIDSLWRYPVKSMRGEELTELFAGFGGVRGDRLFAFHSSASPTEFPYFTGRDQRQMIRYRPHLNGPDGSMVDIETPNGKSFTIDDPALIEDLRAGLEGGHELTLLRSERAMTDCQPLSIFSVQTARKIGKETGMAIDKRRFRANIYVDLVSTDGFAEDEFVGRKIRLGSKVIVSVIKRDGRCMMITLDPDTAEKSPAVLKTVAQAHEGMAGIYAAVVVEGIVRKGDSLELLD